jgi:uncharacterized protein YggT (Ycf19 family)
MVGAELVSVGGIGASPSMLADAVGRVQSFVDVFILVYTLLIFAYIILSFLRLPYSPWLNRMQRFLYDVCEPFLRLFRRIIPPVGPLDLSPMVAVLALLIIRIALDSLFARLH